MSETSNAESRDQDRQKYHRGIRINAGIKREWWATPTIFTILRELGYWINKTSKKHAIISERGAGGEESRQLEDIGRGLGKEA